MTEVPRALRGAFRRVPDFDLARSLRQADILLDATGLYRVESITLWRAGKLFDPRLRSLDAIHVMTALELRPIELFVSYDLRQIEVAHESGLRTVSPGMKK